MKESLNKPTEEDTSFIHIANEEQFKEIKNVVDKYYGVQSDKLDEIDNIDRAQNTREHMEILRRKKLRQSGLSKSPDKNEELDKKGIRKIR